ncbi:MAG: hypothetical protein DRG30_07715 [Epsilonproteobacteria bacterium]|nr:MAG: hypothetical protein DRG30_07715 [Campylobacterota bacterium]
MKRLFKPENIKMLIIILSLMLLVKLGWFVVEMTFLSAQGVDYQKPSKAKALYYRTKFATQKLKQRHVVKAKPLSDISSLKLLALYRSSDRIVITVSKKDKTYVLVRGGKRGEIDGYVLNDATDKEAIFLRGGKSYRLRLLEATKDPQAKSSVRYVPAKRKKPEKQNIPDTPISLPIGEITDADGLRVVDRTLLDHYSKDMKNIWKNIGIKELKENGSITGFKVNFVKRGSDFAKLGLKRGDVIKSINGQELSSYSGAFDIYKNIDTMDSLTLKIERGKKEMELEYEIN